MPLDFHIKTFWQPTNTQHNFLKLIIIQIALLLPNLYCQTLQIENISLEELQEHIFSDTQKFIIIKFNGNEKTQCHKIKLIKEFAAVADFYQVNFQPWIGFLQKMLYQNLKIAKIEFPMVVVFRYAKALLPIFLGSTFDATNPIETGVNIRNILSQLTGRKESFSTIEKFAMPELISLGAM